ncbi:FHA domain-containing serine/threonine-protein kinase [Desulfobacterales bacterium HSG2]|nr:FHA domain-containing serine/threonine-protein kinase [Desulfobacterales bacterium HSG2]
MSGIYNKKEEIVNVTLRIEQGPEKGKTFEFTEPDTFLVGRGTEAHFRLSKEDRYVSRKHFMLEVAPPKCYIRDFGSSNGTKVNRKKVSRTELKAGDIIKVGMTEIKVDLNADEDEGELLWWDEDEDITLEFQKEKKSEPEFPAACSECLADLSDRANSDGRAYELKEAAYLCDDCFEMRKIPTAVEGIDDYQTIQEIGGGSTGVLYATLHKTTGRLVALKMIFIEDARGKARTRFSRGMRAMEKMVHPNVALLLSQGIYKGGNYLISEFLEGGNARQLITEKCKGPVPHKLACKVITDILSGLEYLHQSDHVHRAIKPTNILLTQSSKDFVGTAKLGDCGLAKCYSDAGGSTITEQGEASDTVIYMAPEQILDFRNVKAAADTYSAGMTFYELLTAELPFEKKSKDPVLIVLEDQPVPLNDKNPEVPKALAEVVDRSLRKDVKERFSSATEFREEIEKVMQSD